jgi:hypothetical protein
MIKVFKVFLSDGVFLHLSPQDGGEVLIETAHQQQRRHRSDHQDPDDVHESPPCS